MRFHPLHHTALLLLLSLRSFWCFLLFHFDLQNWNNTNQCLSMPMRKQNNSNIITLDAYALRFTIPLPFPICRNTIDKFCRDTLFFACVGKNDIQAEHHLFIDFYPISYFVITGSLNPCFLKDCIVLTQLLISEK